MRSPAILLVKYAAGRANGPGLSILIDGLNRVTGTLDLTKVDFVGKEIDTYRLDQAQGLADLARG